MYIKWLVVLDVENLESKWAQSSELNYVYIFNTTQSLDSDLNVQYLNQTIQHCKNVSTKVS